MTSLGDVLSLADLRVALEQGYVTQRQHPANPDLRILNYSAKAQYEQAWSNVTMRCRGLIVRGPSLSHAEVISRPWKKFFNLSEYSEGYFHPLTQVSVTDKMDGSLGILYPSPQGGYAIATRGSFVSEQAIEGTKMLQEHLRTWRPQQNLTYLFEIVYPENRIVVDYGQRRELVLLGVVDTASGFPMSHMIDTTWPGPRTAVLSAHTLEEALQLPQRSNAEGVVVRCLRTGRMLKVKQPDYIELHKIVTGLTERTVWEHLSAHHGDYSDLLAQVPDEFHDWVTDVAEGLIDEFDLAQGCAHAAYYEIIDNLDSDFGRGEFAERAKATGPLAPLLFSLLDGKDISPAIWRSLKPAGEKFYQREADLQVAA